MHTTATLNDIQFALAQKYLSNDIISEYQCMRTQDDIMDNIKKLLEKKKHSEHSYDLANIEASTISHANITHFFDDSLSLTNKSKFTEQFEQSIIASALKQVKQNCSSQTYDTMRQYLEKCKIKETENVEKSIEKYKNENQQMSSQIYILKIEKNNLEKDLERSKKIVEGIEEEKKNIKKKIDYILDKENRLYKLQASFAFKEKINLELKKRYERLRDNTLSVQKRVQALYHGLDEIWENITSKAETTDCPNNCWKKDVMSKCKSQLVQERKILKEQSAHIEKEYQVMNMVSSQFKKIFNEPGDKKEQASVQSVSQSQR